MARGVVRVRLLVVGIIVLVVGGPIVGFWGMLGGVRTVKAEEGWRMVGEAGAVLVDVRPAEDYAAGHLAGAVNWPFGAAMKGEELPRELAGRKMLMVCPSGIQSARVTRRVNESGLGEAYNVAGGMQEWIAAGPATEEGVRRMSGVEGAAIVGAFLAVKATCTLLGVMALVWMCTKRGRKMAALRWGMAAFVAAEVLGIAGLVWFSGRSMVLENLRGCGMAIAVGFAAFGLLEAVERGWIGFGEAGRAFEAGEGGGERGLSRWGLSGFLRRSIPVAIVAATIPMCVPMRLEAYRAEVFGQVVVLGDSLVQQYHSFRYLPVVGILLLGCSLAATVGGRDWAVDSKALFCAGVGALGFALLRVVLFVPFAHNPVWYRLWEEMAGGAYLLVVVGIWGMRKGEMASDE